MDIVNHVQKLAHKNTIILTFVNDGYFPMFNVWYELFCQHGIHNYLVIALDKSCYKKLRSKGINTELLDLSGDLFSKQNLWVLRIELINKILLSGINVLHTDVDAFWIKNPLNIIYEEKQDLMISRDEGIPKEAVETWGFSMCCGFYFLRSNSTTRAFMVDLLAKTHEWKDDQRAFNYMFLEEQIDWPPDGSFGKIAHIKKYDLHICLLPYDVVVRGEDYPDSYVFHPWLYPKDVYGKVTLAIKELKYFDNCYGGQWAFINMLKLMSNIGYWKVNIKNIAKKVLNRK